jgi:hypothetical protein
LGTKNRLFVAAQVLVGLIDPVGAWRIENIQVNRILKRFSLVRHVGRDAKNFSRVDNNFLAVDPELQGAVEDVSQLLVVVAMLGNNAPFLEQHSSHHYFLADYELPLQQRV